MKKFITIGIVLVALNFTSCITPNGKASKQDVGNFIFDEVKARETANEYIKNISKKDFNKASEVCAEDLQKQTLEINAKDINIKSFKLEDIVQKGTSCIYKYKVNSSEDEKMITDLDNYYITVEKLYGKYKVASVKANTEIEVFVKDERLSLRNKDEAQVKKVIDLSKLPNEAYSKAKSSNLEKIDIPKKSFGLMNFSFKGNKLAISSIDNEKTYIAILDISGSEGSEEEGKQGKGDNEGDSDSGGRKETSVAKKINTVDIYEKVKLKDIIFTGEKDNLVVSYYEEGKERFKLYDSKGNIIETRIDTLFPKKEYGIIYEDFKDDVLTFKTVTGSSENYISQRYKLSIKELKPIKI